MEEELQDYTQWLMKVWNPNQLYIPFAADAPSAYLRYKAEQLVPSPTAEQNNQFICHDCNKPAKEYRDGLCQVCYSWHTAS